MENLLIILNLIFIESILSIDNASILALMVKKLPEKQRKRALLYGLFGAYFFRGLCLATASFLIKISWLKILGGIYLIYLAYDYFFSDKNDDGKDTVAFTFLNRLGISNFIKIIITVECMDLVFSIDNVFAAVALSNSIYSVIIGVFIGILTMRFIAGKFVDIFNKYTNLERNAFIVVCILGVKLFIYGILNYIPKYSFLLEKINSQEFHLIFSLITMQLFLYPVIIKKK